MQASSCNFTNSKMQTSQIIKHNRHIGTSKLSVESYSGYWDSIKRKKIDSTDWPVGEQGGNLSDNCVFTRVRPTRHIPEHAGSDKLSPKRASNHRYGPRKHTVASGAVGRINLVPRRTAATAAYRVAGSG